MLFVGNRSRDKFFGWIQVQRDGGKTAMRSVVKTLAGGLGISMILGIHICQIACTPQHLKQT